MENGKWKFYRRINKGTPLECITYVHLNHGTQVTIQTPNYPQNYPNNAKCPWLMTIPAKTKIIINAGNILRWDPTISITSTTG